MPDGDYIWTVVIGALIGWFIHASLHTDSFETRHDYVLICDSNLKDGTCSGTLHHEHIITYSVSREHQLVVERYSDGDGAKYDDCAVTDVTHWNCTENIGGQVRYFGCDDFGCSDWDYNPKELRVGWLRYHLQSLEDPSNR